MEDPTSKASVSSSAAGAVTFSPVVSAYSLPAAMTTKPAYYRFRASWIVDCEFCRRLHFHGYPEGDRAAHCPGASHEDEFEGRPRPSSYELKYAGEAHSALIAKLNRHIGRRH